MARAAFSDKRARVELCVCDLGMERVSSVLVVILFGSDNGRRPSRDAAGGNALVGEGVKIPRCRRLASAARAAAVSLRDVDIEMRLLYCDSKSSRQQLIEHAMQDIKRATFHAFTFIIQDDVWKGTRLV